MSRHAPYLRGAEPFFFTGGETGCLCLHGFTASPAEVRWLGEHLRGCGFTVYGQRLAGHGTDPRHLARSTWRDWYASALDGYHLLRGACQRIVLVGHSMGGLLALLLATEVEAAGVAALATPLRFSSRVMANARWLRYPLPYSMQPDRSSLPQVVRQEQVRRGEEVVGRVRYDRWSSAAVAQLYALSRYTESQLSQVTAPLLLVYSQADRTAVLAQSDYIASAVSSKLIERHILEKSGHILTQDVEREQVFTWVAGFVAAVANSSEL
jgi:carboxylesterase